MIRLFDMTVIINAVELLKYNFDIREEARNTFIAVDYYRDILSDGMAEDDIVQEYIDLFNAADPGVIFDNYITVDTDGVKYNFEEDSADEGQHRDSCFYKVPCTFDLGKYIKAMDQMNAQDAGEDDEIGITVYRETISHDLAGDDNLETLIVKRDMLMKYFKERILPDFRGDDKTVSDEGLLQEWLDEYTADDTTDLYDFIQFEEKKARGKEYYQKLYDEKYDKLLEDAKNDGCPDPEQEANEAFNESATAEEVVGYYIEWHGNEAFKDWVENSQFYERERGEAPSEQDREVTRILGELYGGIVVKDIEWYIPEGTPVSSKLSETKIVPESLLAGNSSDAHAESICLYLKLQYGTEPKAFAFTYPNGRLGRYRNWELSSTTKKDEGVGCHGAGSEPCLNGCPGCDKLKPDNTATSRKFQVIYVTYATIGIGQVQKAYISERECNFDLIFPDNEILTKVLIQKILKWMEEHKEATV